MLLNKSGISLNMQHFSNKGNMRAVLSENWSLNTGPKIDLHWQSNSAQSSGLLLHKFYEYSSTAPIL